MEMEYSQSRLHTGMGVIERATQSLKILIIGNLEHKIGLTESINRALRAMRFTVHTGLEVSPFELHHDRNPRTQLTNIIQNNKSYLSDWMSLKVSMPPKQIPINVALNEKREVTDHIILAGKKKADVARHTNHQRKSQ